MYESSPFKRTINKSTRGLEVISCQNRYFSKIWDFKNVYCFFFFSLTCLHRWSHLEKTSCLFVCVCGGKKSVQSGVHPSWVRSLYFLFAMRYRPASLSDYIPDSSVSHWRRESENKAWLSGAAVQRSDCRPEAENRWTKPAWKCSFVRRSWAVHCTRFTEGERFWDLRARGIFSSHNTFLRIRAAVVRASLATAADT